MWLILAFYGCDFQSVDKLLALKLEWKYDFFQKMYALVLWSNGKKTFILEKGGKRPHQKGGMGPSGPLFLKKGFICILHYSRDSILSENVWFYMSWMTCKSRRQKQKCKVYAIIRCSNLVCIIIDLKPHRPLYKPP